MPTLPAKGGAWWQFLPQALHFITLGEHGAVKFDFAPQNRTEVCNFIPRIMTKPLVQWLNRNFFNVSGNNKIPEFSLVWAFVSLKDCVGAQVGKPTPTIEGACLQRRRREARGDKEQALWAGLTQVSLPR